jgi:hypothetical protein
MREDSTTATAPTVDQFSQLIERARAGLADPDAMPSQRIRLLWAYACAARDIAAAGSFFVTLVTCASRPPILRAAIKKILKRKCARAVNLDTVVDFSVRLLKLSAQRGVHRNGTPATGS